MSAIVALIHLDSTPIDSAVFAPMLERIAYRGPDGQTAWIDGHVALAHSLFKTCDQDIVQPYTWDNITVCAQVRIDARDELVPKLRGAGIEARHDAPDVELLAQAYRAWGDDCLKHLLGDFAFVLWDARRQHVLAARDHLGVQPLFHARVGQSLIISTEIGAIRLHPDVTSTLNEQVIGDFLVTGNALWVEKTTTVFADIARLPPAHALRVDGQQVSVGCYWQLPVDEPMLRYRSETAYVEHFLDIFKRAVKDRMRSGRIVISMSGGLDSPCVAAMATQLVRSGEVNADVSALSLIYDRVHPDTEAYYSSLAARKLGLTHVLFNCDDYRLQRPFGVFAQPGLTFQSGLEVAYVQALQSLGDTTLGGAGADEILWYTPFIEILKGMPPRDAFDLLRWQWQFLGRRPAFGGLKRALRRHPRRNRQRLGFAYPTWLKGDFAQRADLQARYESVSSWTPEQRHHLHPDSYLSILRPDRQSTMEMLDTSGGYIVAASPFFDLRLLGLALTLPPQPWFDQKYMLRRAFQGWLPAEVLTRKKTPAGDILNSMLQQPGVEWVDQWEAVPELAPYLQRAAVPPLTGEQRSPAYYVDIRPLMLNEWLLHCCN